MDRAKAKIINFNKKPDVIKQAKTISNLATSIVVLENFNIIYKGHKPRKIEQQKIKITFGVIIQSVKASYLLKALKRNQII